MIPVFEILQELTNSALQQIATSLRDGLVRGNVGTHAIAQIVGVEIAEKATNLLSELGERGWQPGQIATLLEAVRETRAASGISSRNFELVVSGPSVEGVNTRDTLAVMQSMIADAVEEVILVGYAFHNGKTLFAPLVQKMQADPSLEVSIYLNVMREAPNQVVSLVEVERFVDGFLAENWPWESRPKIYYDARCLAGDARMSSLHAKCLICDRRQALVSSANFTEAAQRRNIEVGLVVRHLETITRLVDYLDGLRHAGVLAEADVTA